MERFLNEEGHVPNKTPITVVAKNKNYINFQNPKNMGSQCYATDIRDPTTKTSEFGYLLMLSWCILFLGVHGYMDFFFLNNDTWISYNKTNKNTLS